MPEKASFLESTRACRGHCTSSRRNPSDTVGVVDAHSTSSQFGPVRPSTHSHSPSSHKLGSQMLASSPHFLHAVVGPSQP